MNYAKLLIVILLLLSTRAWAESTDLCLRLPGAPLGKSNVCRDFFSWEETSRPNLLIQEFNRLIAKDNLASERTRFNVKAAHLVWSQEDRALVQAANPEFDFAAFDNRFEMVRAHARELSGWEDIELLATVSPSATTGQQWRWEYRSSVYQSAVFIGNEEEFIKHLQEPHASWISGSCDKVEISTALSERLKSNPSSLTYLGPRGPCLSNQDRSMSENLLNPGRSTLDTDLMKVSADPKNERNGGPPTSLWSEKSTHWLVGIVLTSLVAGYALKDKTVVITR